jgi:hypothetical protein
MVSCFFVADETPVQNRDVGNYSRFFTDTKNFLSGNCNPDVFDRTSLICVERVKSSLLMGLYFYMGHTNPYIIIFNWLGLGFFVVRKVGPSPSKEGRPIP